MASGKLAHRVGVNFIADYTEEEKRLLLNPYRPTNVRGAFEPKKLEPIPDVLNWTQEGVVNPVGDQGMCGSCYAFSAIGAFEGAVAIQMGKLEQFSIQQLIDCSEDNHGCSGGYISQALEFFKNNCVCTTKEYGEYTKR